jgi:hypothetical protein
MAHPRTASFLTSFLTPFFSRLASRACLVALLLGSGTSSCALFSTRTPETPDTRRTSFQPPTSPQLVIANLLNAIREKNAENYLQCMVSETSSGTGSSTGASASAGRVFVFEPSAEAAARFAAVFVGWNTSRERQAFLAMVARIPSTAAPVVGFSNDRFEVLLPDSAVYVADYLLQPNYLLSGVPSSFQGKVRLSISALQGGFWGISRWSDQATASATASATSASWSVLKAQFAN